MDSLVENFYIWTMTMTTEEYLELASHTYRDSDTRDEETESTDRVSSSSTSTVVIFIPEPTMKRRTA